MDHKQHRPPATLDDEPSQTEPADDDRASPATGPAYVKVHDNRPEGYDGTCLRPLGLCDLGGCCEICWYRPDHPRFQKGGS